jgi:hypothetical protein
VAISGSPAIGVLAVTDLERLIATKQDRLRGRRRDWLDDFADWRQRVDSEAWIAVTLLLLLAVLVWLS